MEVSLKLSVDAGRDRKWHGDVTTVCICFLLENCHSFVYIFLQCKLLLTEEM